MTAPSDIWANSRDGTRVHAYEWGGGNATPLVFVPGGTGNAWMAEPFAADLAVDRRVISISRRGMGLSAAPTSGYTPTDFADDVASIVRAAALSRFVYFGHSMGVPIGLEYALRLPRGLAGVILGDAPAAYIDFAAADTFGGFLKMQLEFSDWEEAFRVAGLGDRARFDRVRHRSFRERDGRIVALIDRASIERTVEESRVAHTEYWPRLPKLGVPVLLLRATTGWTPLTDADVERYRDALPAIRVVALPADHSLGLNADPSLVVAALRAFMTEIDARARITA